jgi:signal transduction histidine kinase
VVAHDLRSPLARITGYADFLREEASPRLDPQHQDFLERLCAGTERMRTLIDDLLGYATAENRPLHTAPVDLTAMAGEIARERTGGAGDSPPTIIVDPLPPVEGDATLLRQVLENLIGNAIKYTRYGTDPWLRISGRPVARQVRVEVTDRGIGIPPEQRAQVFTAFARAAGSEAYPGTGLGLAIVQRIIERHGGEVGVEDGPDGGSRFWFTLPRPQGPRPCRATAGPTTENDQPGPALARRGPR